MNPSCKLGERIRFARVLKGFSQQQLGEAVSCSRQYIHQVEAGLKLPSDELFAAICESLSITPRFADGEFHNELQPEQCHFRKRRSTPLSLAARVAAFGTLLEVVLDYVEQFVELPSPFLFELQSCEEGDKGTYSREAIERIAERFRVGIGLGVDTPIGNITALLENLGVIVTAFSGVSDKVDALSFSRGRHFVLRNTEKQSTCRQRFDLAHELGHLVLHQGVETGCHTTEAEADHFASAFLFPRKAFIREFPMCVGQSGRFKWIALEKLKLRWKVSLRAIIYRAHSLGMIDSRQYRAANVKLSKEGLPEKGDEKIALEEPTLLENTFSLLRDELKISFPSFAEGLGLQPDYLAAMLGITYESGGARDNVSAMRPLRFS